MRAAASGSIVHSSATPETPHVFVDPQSNVLEPSTPAGRQHGRPRGRRSSPPPTTGTSSPKSKIPAMIISRTGVTIAISMSSAPRSPRSLRASRAIAAISSPSFRRASEPQMPVAVPCHARASARPSDGGRRPTSTPGDHADSGRRSSDSHAPAPRRRRGHRPQSTRKSPARTRSPGPIQAPERGQQFDVASTHAAEQEERQEHRRPDEPAEHRSLQTRRPPLTP